MLTRTRVYNQPTGKLLKQVRLIVMCEIDEEVSPSMEDVNEAVKAFNAHKRAWTEISQNFPMEKRMMALEEVVKKSLEDPTRNASSAVASEMPPSNDENSGAY